MSETFFANPSPSGDAEVKPNVALMIGRIIGCKWGYSMLGLMRQGVTRPGAMRRHLPGLTPKVLTECLHIMVEFGIVQRTSYATKIPHVDYILTTKGEEFGTILDAITALQNKWLNSAVDV